MPLRERAREIRKKFSRGSSETSGASSEASSTMGDELTRHTTHTVYRPGEKIPYKYRRPVDKAHKEKLEAFSFSSAWNERPKSFASQYSPMGSRFPSPRSSMEMLAGARSMHLRRSDTGDTTEGSDEDITPADCEFCLYTCSCPVNLHTNLHFTVGLSLDNSHGSPFPNAVDNALISTDDLEHPHPRSRRTATFTAEDLTLALQRSRIEVPS